MGYRGDGSIDLVWDEYELIKVIEDQVVKLGRFF